MALHHRLLSLRHGGRRARPPQLRHGGRRARPPQRLWLQGANAIIITITIITIIIITTSITIVIAIVIVTIIRWALAQTAALLAHSGWWASSQETIMDAAAAEITKVFLTPAHLKLLNECTEKFFTARAVLQSTPREGTRAALQIKDTDAIRRGWEEIISRRRSAEPDDQKAITDRSVLADLHAKWMSEWCRENLTDRQRRKSWSKKTSIFNVHLHQNFGGKHFVMALWQTGVTWAPSPVLTNMNRDGAAEHVARQLVRWIRQVMHAIESHKNAPATVVARTRSGPSKGKHGLTDEEENDRREREEARRNYFMTVELNSRLLASKGKGEGKGERGAAEHAPKTWREMTDDERWWLEELWSGRLKRRKERAEGKMQKIEAGDFRKIELCDFCCVSEFLNFGIFEFHRILRILWMCFDFVISRSSKPL